MNEQLKFSDLVTPIYQKDQTCSTFSYGDYGVNFTYCTQEDPRIVGYLPSPEGLALITCVGIAAAAGYNFSRLARHAHGYFKRQFGFDSNLEVKQGVSNKDNLRDNSNSLSNENNAESFCSPDNPESPLMEMPFVEESAFVKTILFKNETATAKKRVDDKLKGNGSKIKRDSTLNTNSHFKIRR